PHHAGSRLARHGRGVRSRRHPLAGQPDRGVASPEASGVTRFGPEGRAPARRTSTAQGADAPVSSQQKGEADPYFPANGDPRYRVHRYELTLDYRPGPNRLAGSARLGAIAGPAPITEFQLNLADFRIGRIRVDGRAPHYSHRGGRLRIRPPKPIRAGAAFT